jgi:hypothetical protein
MPQTNTPRLSAAKRFLGQASEFLIDPVFIAQSKFKRKRKTQTQNAKRKTQNAELKMHKERPNVRFF